jgi:hypothetical protein
MFCQGVLLFLWAITDGKFSLYPYYFATCIPSFVWFLANTYVADVIPHRYRAAFFAFNSALWSFTNIWGSALADMFDTIEVTAGIALAMQICALLMAIFVIDETFPVAERKPFDWYAPLLAGIESHLYSVGNPCMYELSDSGSDSGFVRREQA